MKQWFKISNQASGLPVIYIYGILSPYPDEDTVSYAEFQAAFRSLEPLHQSCEIRINCVGGSILEGLAMYDMIKLSAMRVITIVEGVAASMAAILFQAGDERVMYPNSRLMIHRAQGGIYGDADAIRSYADQVGSCEDSIKNILKERAGLSDSDVAALMQPNVDTWITADDAVNKYHLADKIIQPVKAININLQNIATKKPEELYRLFSNQLTNQIDIMNKLKATLVVLLAHMGVTLSLEDSDEKFADEVKKAFDEKEKTISNIKKTNAEAIVNSAKLKGLVKDDEVEMFVNIGISSPATLVTMLGKLDTGTPAPAAPAAATPTNTTTIVNLNGGLKPGETPENTAGDRAKWTYMDWAKNDPKALAKMETAEPEKFNALVANINNSAREKGWIG